MSAYTGLEIININTSKNEVGTEMYVDGINCGFVLDHITAGKGMEIYKALELDKLDCSVAVIQNVKSSKYGRKDIIKIDSMIDLNFDNLGYIDKNITVNTIKDGKLIDKGISPPTILVNILRCKNPRCITSTERGVDHIFKMSEGEDGVYRCIYCESDHKEKTL